MNFLKHYLELDCMDACASLLHLGSGSCQGAGSLTFRSSCCIFMRRVAQTDVRLSLPPTHSRPVYHTLLLWSRDKVLPQLCLILCGKTARSTWRLYCFHWDEFVSKYLVCPDVMPHGVYFSLLPKYVFFCFIDS